MPDGRIKAADSPRWCATCARWGEHHTDRCPNTLLARYEEFPKLRRDPGKPTASYDWIDVALYGVIAVACVALAFWLATRHVDPCPGGWHERTTPTATVCTNPKLQPRRR